MFEWIKDIPKALAVLSAIVPLIQLLVRTVETPGFGPEKKAEVLNGIDNVLDELKVPEAVQGLVLMLAGGVIEVYVWVQNLTGFFTHRK